MIVIDKIRSDHTKEKVLHDQKHVEVALSVKLRVVQLDDKLISIYILVIFASLLTIS